MTVRNGRTTGEAGAGVWATQSAGGSVELEASSCLFAGNLAQDSVGGAIAAQGPLSVEDSEFTSNRAYSGGAVYLWATATPASFLDTGFSNNSIRDSTNVYGWQGSTIFSTPRT